MLPTEGEGRYARLMELYNKNMARGDRPETAAALMRVLQDEFPDRMGVSRQQTSTPSPKPSKKSADAGSSAPYNDSKNVDGTGGVSVNSPEATSQQVSKAADKSGGAPLSADDSYWKYSMANTDEPDYAGDYYGGSPEAQQLGILADLAATGGLIAGGRYGLDAWGRRGRITESDPLDLYGEDASNWEGTGAKSGKARKTPMSKRYFGESYPTDVGVDEFGKFNKVGRNGIPKAGKGTPAGGLFGGSKARALALLGALALGANSDASAAENIMDAGLGMAGMEPEYLDPGYRRVPLREVPMAFESADKYLPRSGAEIGYPNLRGDFYPAGDGGYYWDNPAFAPPDDYTRMREILAALAARGYGMD